jgi:hypothetical protein
MGKGAGDIVDKVTLNIGTIKGGVKVNMVPSSAVTGCSGHAPVPGPRATSCSTVAIPAPGR